MIASVFLWSCNKDVHPSHLILVSHEESHVRRDAAEECIRAVDGQWEFARTHIRCGGNTAIVCHGRCSLALTNSTVVRMSPAALFVLRHKRRRTCSVKSTAVPLLCRKTNRLDCRHFSQDSLSDALFLQGAVEYSHYFKYSRVQSSLRVLSTSVATWVEIRSVTIETLTTRSSFCGLLQNTLWCWYCGLLQNIFWCWYCGVLQVAVSTWCSCSSSRVEHSPGVALEVTLRNFSLQGGIGPSLVKDKDQKLLASDGLRLTGKILRWDLSESMRWN